MRNFTNPLDNIHIASPCPANWDEMFGNDRKRFCGECKLNVYNLSDMTRREAENLLINSEGRLCVRFFRRADGTVLTKNCPVGWRAVKQRVSRVATAAFSMVAGMITGVVGYNLLPTDQEPTTGLAVVPNVTTLTDDAGPYEEIRGGIRRPAGSTETGGVGPGSWTEGQMTLGKAMIVVKPAPRRKKLDRP
jgi:hypothetical protein